MFIDDVPTGEDRLERMRAALAALTSLTAQPQERLDRAVSRFLRAFRGEPEDGPMRDCYRALRTAIGDPPFGTTVTADIATMSPDELEALSAAVVQMFELVIAEAIEAARNAA